MSTVYWPLLFLQHICHLNKWISEPLHFNTPTPCSLLTPLARAMHSPLLASLHVDSETKVLKIIFAQAISNKAHSEFMFSWFPPWSPCGRSSARHDGHAAARSCHAWKVQMWWDWWKRGDIGKRGVPLVPGLSIGVSIQWVQVISYIVLNIRKIII